MNTKGTGTLISPTGAERKPKAPATTQQQKETESQYGEGQRGLDMVIPPGYNKDNCPIFASSGERAIVIPKNATRYTGGFEGMSGGSSIVNNNTSIINQQPGQSAAAVADALIYQMQRASAARTAGIKYAGR